MPQVFNRLPLNMKGDDYVVGDIHGRFTELAGTLDLVGFSEVHDRLFATGNLFGDSPDINEVSAWLDRPWFHPVLGRQELMLLRSLSNSENEIWWCLNGGEWWMALASAVRDKIARQVEAIPYLLEVPYIDGLIRLTGGISHAGVQSHSWHGTIQRLESDPSVDGDVVEGLYWGGGAALAAGGVPDIGRVFMGGADNRSTFSGNLIRVASGTMDARSRISVLSLDIDFSSL